MGRRQYKAAAYRNRKQAGSAKKSILWGAGIGLAIVAAFLAAQDAGATHPEPRANAQAHHVVPQERYTDYPRIAQVYAQAAEIKEVLDGIYCYCECSKHSGHYSLLECFETDHGAACDVCLSEAALAYRMHQDGKTLDQIRDAVDGLYGG